MAHDEQWIIGRLQEYAERHFRDLVTPIPIESITLLKAKDSLLHAQVVGTQPYLVTFKADPVNVFVSCTCPVKRDWCKHAVAVVKHLPELAPRRDPLLTSALGRMSAAELVTLLDAFRSQFPQAEPLLTTLAVPEWFDRDHPGGVRRTIVAVNEARRTHRVADWERAAGMLRHELGDGNLASMLTVVEQAIGFLALEDGTALRDDRFTSLIARLLEQHRELVREVERPVDDLADFLVKQYFTPTLPDPDLEDYEPLLDDGGFDAVLAAAAARGTTGTFAKGYANVAVDVALARHDVYEAEQLSAVLNDRDKLFWYFERNDFDAECEELLRRAIDPADPVQLSAPLIRFQAAQYVDADTVRGFLRRELRFQPSTSTFFEYLEAPGQTYHEVMTTLAELGLNDPNWELSAATEFGLYDEGLFIVENHSVNSLAVGRWAVDVELPRDPVTAVRRLYAYFRVWLTGMPELPLPRTRESAAHVALRVRQLRTRLLLDVKDPLLAAEGLAQWEGQLAVFKADFGEWPFMAEALAAHEL
ncbi:SWIM zinc finger family protein [Corynebacterium sp. TA-R-1]|uniref:SWIM zinc finger family protein n=1 Tax=Corynebacterium stercoris TaxID=2943490 RepID=A0ABT1G0Z7_9CORY|nr:SWIM zinc finger family protein [Corynebacterium stercoris]MCP1387700.1 SWIM zinc finger family protein [Corynebacterium stercoris]